MKGPNVVIGWKRRSRTSGDIGEDIEHIARFLSVLSCDQCIEEVTGRNEETSAVESECGAEFRSGRYDAEAMARALYLHSRVYVGPVDNVSEWPELRADARFMYRTRAGSILAIMASHGIELAYHDAVDHSLVQVAQNDGIDLS